MKLTIDGSTIDLRKIARAWNEVFSGPGTYTIEPEMLKAESAEGNFDEWFLEQLSRHAAEKFVGLRDRLWEILDEWITGRSLRPSEAEWFELQQALFDLSRANTAHMVGLVLPQDLRDRLRLMGFSEAEVLDFPGLAYRMGKLWTMLQRHESMPWADLVKIARGFPLTPAEEAGLKWARQRAGNYLRPIFDEAGRLWTADREVRPLRRLLDEAARTRQHPHEVARALGASLRAQGNFRDADRVARTEIAYMRSHGSWNSQREQWDEDTGLFRQTSTRACDDCLRLYKRPDGLPRVYSVQALEALDALGPNRSPRDSWVAKIGPTHPNCACSPWQRWYEQMASVFQPRAKQYAERLAAA